MREAAQVALHAENVVPQLIAGKDYVVEVVEYGVGRRVAVGLGFFEHHVELTLQLVGWKDGALHEVGKQLHGALQALLRKHGVEHG